MLLRELFDYGEPMGIEQDLKKIAANLLTPLVDDGVPKIAINSMIAKLNQSGPVRIDRELAMKLLDPTELPLIKAIEGDYLILNQPTADEWAGNEDEEAKAQARIQDTAEKQASKELKKSSDTPKPPKPKTPPI